MTTIDADADLLPRCRAGDEVAWRELVTRHTRKVFGLAYRFTGRVDQAEDLTQEVFVKVYQTLGRYRESDGPFGGWLMAVARNHAIDQYRRGKQERLRRTDDPALLETMPARDETSAWAGHRASRGKLRTSSRRPCRSRQARSRFRSECRCWMNIGRRPACG